MARRPGQGAWSNVPLFRAIIKGDVLTLVPPYNAVRGSEDIRRHLEQPVNSGLALADLTTDPRTDGRKDLIVAPHGEVSENAQEVLVRWAEAVGYRRVWLPDRVVDLDFPPLYVAEVTCPTCGFHQRGEGIEFWASIRDRGSFPGMCELCGGILPQWHVEPVPESHIQG